MLTVEPVIIVPCYRSVIEPFKESFKGNLIPIFKALIVEFLTEPFALGSFNPPEINARSRKPPTCGYSTALLFRVQGSGFRV